MFVLYILRLDTANIVLLKRIWPIVPNKNVKIISAANFQF